MATVAIHVLQKRSGITEAMILRDWEELISCGFFRSCSLFITEGNAHKHIRSLNRVLYLFRLSEESSGSSAGGEAT